jgi:hypothetical protein
MQVQEMILRAMANPPIPIESVWRRWDLAKLSKDDRTGNPHFFGRLSMLPVVSF